jgi:hypothetical protein
LADGARRTAANESGKKDNQSKMVSARDIVALQDGLTKQWHDGRGAELGGIALLAPAGTASPKSPGDDEARGQWLKAIGRQHRANFDLWHIEDEARTPGATDAEIAAVKRRIDLTNQLRNDLIEELDCFLLGWLKSRGLPDPGAPLHSEPPGMIVDRLSILALKIYHTNEEAERKDAPPGHQARNQERLAILEEQRVGLAGCLDVLWQEVLNRRRSFKVYRQLKMYNDPALNPAIYGKCAPGQGE